MRLKHTPSRRSIRNALRFYGGETVMEQGPPRRKRGKQKESLVNDAVKEWRKLRRDVSIYRNNVGSVEWKPGAWLRYGLCNGSSDFIGWQSVTVTPSMLGKKVAVFLAIESKTDSGVLTPEQLAFIEAVRDAGGKAGVVRSAADAEALVNA